MSTFKPIVRLAKESLLYFGYWILFFGIGRIFFLLINYDQSAHFHLTVLMGSLMHGLWLDASISGYMTLIFLLFRVVFPFLGPHTGRIFRIFHLIILAIFCLGVVANAVLYTYWSVPLDVTALEFLKTPTEAMASVDWWLMFLPIVCGILVFLGFKRVYSKVGFFEEKLKINTWSGKGLYILNGLFLMVVCVLPIRGGIGIVPVNISYVYFHKDIFPNHAAYNPVWNVLYSWIESSADNDFRFMEDKVAQEKIRFLNETSDSGWIDLPVKQGSKPNVILVILESFLSELIDKRVIGKEVTPNLNTLCREGIYFSNLYASGDRSDKGLVSIFSGYPAMPKSSLVQFPEKFSETPSMLRDFKAAGYHTSFYYGGNLDFANLRSYFLASDPDVTVTDKDMPSNAVRGKWGVHDEWMFKRFNTDLKARQAPFFASFFTLSNHDPYDIPAKFTFGKRNSDEKYLSAANYTDMWIGWMTNQLKRSGLWENSLVVLVADHGLIKLGMYELFDPRKYHIPMVWTGGVVEKPMIFDKVFSQTDIPLMLLGMTGVKPKNTYVYSRRPDAKGSKPYAVYFFNNGIGFKTPECLTVYDNVTRDYYRQFCLNDSLGSFGQAYLQILSQDFTGKQTH